MSGIKECKGNLLIKAKTPVEGFAKVVNRGELGLKHMDFGLLRLFPRDRDNRSRGASGEWSGETGDCEQALDIYSGIVSMEIASGQTYGPLGGRKSVFDGRLTVVYLPPGTSYKIRVLEGPVEIAVFSATAPSFAGEPMVIGPEDVIITTPGKDNWRRDVHTALGNNVNIAKLIFGETTNPPGNWSSAPPHKHDAFNLPNEVPLEEVYYFQVDPPQGFGVIRVYTGPNDPGPMDEIYVVEQGDTVVIPRGYHPVGAAPGYTLNYTWAMAGEIRKPGASFDDPRHAWLKNT